LKSNIAKNDSRMRAAATAAQDATPVLSEVDERGLQFFPSVLFPSKSKAIRKAMPELSPSKIAAGTYRSLEKDCSTIGMFNFVVGQTADLTVYVSKIAAP
jgi:hypothetical protein